MAHSKSAQKRIRQNATARARNRWRLRTMREAVKGFHNALANGSPAEAAEAFKSCSAVIDRSAQKGVIHRNQASRRKSRLNAQLKAKVKG